MIRRHKPICDSHKNDPQRPSGRLIVCRLCHRGWWSKDIDVTEDHLCKACVKRHRLDNFYGLAKALLMQDIIMNPDEEPAV